MSQDVTVSFDKFSTSALDGRRLAAGRRKHLLHLEWGYMDRWQLGRERWEAMTTISLH